MQESAATTGGLDTRDRVSPFAIAIFILAASAVIYCAFFAGFPIDHDAAVMIQVGDVMLRGGVPYRDVVEITPPMAPALHIVPLLVAKLTPISVPTAFHLCVTIIVAFSCWQIWSLLGLWNPPYPANQRLMFLAGWLSATLSLQLALDYGQREHLFALLLVPWLLCRMARYENLQLPARITVTLGIVAGPCFLMKPFFLAVVVAIEFVLFARTRKFWKLVAPESALVVCWGTAYFIYLVTLPQDARRELFGFLIPYLIHHYSAYAGSFFWTENLYTYAWIAVAIVIAAAAVYRRPPQVRLHAFMLFLAVLFCFGTFWLQGKGWFYQQIPIRFTATALLAFALCGQPFSKRSSWTMRSTPLGYPVYLIMLCTPVVGFLVAYYSYRLERIDYIDAMTAKIRQYASPGDYVDFVCTDVRRAYPSMIYAGVRLGSRYDVEFILPMVYAGVEWHPGQPLPYRSASEQPEEERRYLQEKADDIARFRPKLVGLDSDLMAQALPLGFRIDDYLDFIGWRQKVLAHYRYVETFKDFRLYVLE